MLKHRTRPAFQGYRQALEPSISLQDIKHVWGARITRTRTRYCLVIVLECMLIMGNESAQCLVDGYNVVIYHWGRRRVQQRRVVRGLWREGPPPPFNTTRAVSDSMMSNCLAVIICENLAKDNQIGTLPKFGTWRKLYGNHQLTP